MNSLCFKIIRRLRYEYLRRFENPATLKTKMGIFRVPIGVKDPISRHLFLHGEYELDLIEEAMDLLRERSGRRRGQGTVLDIGANNGVISIGMLVTGQLDRAIAIEPEPANFAKLQENVGLNNLDGRIFRIQSALSDQKSELIFELSESNWGDHRTRSSTGSLTDREIFQESDRETITVQGDRLDRVLEMVPTEYTDDIAVIWIDVQGYEGYIFRGARELLSTGIPVVSEIWPYGIARAGLSLEEFSELVQEVWTSFWVRRKRRWIRYPISVFDCLIDEIGPGAEYANVIFMKEES